ALRLWLEGELSTFPDIDFAWQAGLNALAEHGISIGSTPLFLLIGSSDERQQRAIIDATGRTLSVTGVSEGPAALRWYADPDGIYLFASDASWLSALERAFLERKQREANAAGE